MHECPECGMIGFCGVDIDDIDTGEHPDCACPCEECFDDRVRVEEEELSEDEEIQLIMDMEEHGDQR